MQIPSPFGMIAAEMARCFQRPWLCSRQATIPPLRGRRSSRKNIRDAEIARSRAEDKDRPLRSG